ncbi:MAG: TonB family protein [Cyclobacteriaceae bacterium]|jgi:TonB family protein|nr:TonB family protein [Flammeovirgaceae bacterium]
MRALLIPVILFLQLLIANCYAQSNDEFQMPDESASYPGGMVAFYQYLFENLGYPTSARQNNIEGTLFVSFVVGADGFIESSSLRIVSGLSKDCDEEVMRVLKLNKANWLPAQKGGKPMRQLFTVPIQFKLDPNVSKPLNYKSLEPITTIVNSSSDKDAGWSLFADTKIENRIGRIQAGDSVTVIGWAPWQYRIKTKDKEGYVRHSAIFITPELKPHADYLVSESGNWQALIDRADSVRKVEIKNIWIPIISRLRTTNSERLGQKKRDSLALQGYPMSYLHISKSKDRIVIGECVTISILFYVHQLNKIRLQFTELGDQIRLWEKTNLKKDDCWLKNSLVSEIKSEEKKFKDQTYYAYKLFSAAYCPTKAETLTFEPMSLKIARMSLTHLDSIDKLITYQTKRTQIVVDPIPEKSKIYNLDFYYPVGEWIVKDTASATSISAGDSIVYSFTLSSRGLIYPLPSIEISKNGIHSNLLNELHLDTIINETYYAQKKYTYSITFDQPGVYDIGKLFNYQYLNSKIKRVEIVQGKSKIEVVPSNLIVKKKIKKLASPTYSGVIAFDVSQSMLIEDYTPSRLGAVKIGVANFFEKHTNCNIGLIAFGGNTKWVNVDGACYSKQRVESFTYQSVESGTAIGEAIRVALKSMNADPNEKKKIVIIGDGDNTAGLLSPALASELAKKKNVAIYAIGVGSKGLVKFGKDLFGKPRFVDNSFSDEDFKKISLATGGKYYWAKDAVAIAEILQEIF